MTVKHTLSLIETISHSFELEDIPSDIDLEDTTAVYQWALDSGKIDFSNGEPIGDSELSLIRNTL